MSPSWACVACTSALELCTAFNGTLQGAFARSVAHQGMLPGTQHAGRQLDRSDSDHSCCTSSPGQPAQTLLPNLYIVPLAKKEAQDIVKSSMSPKVPRLCFRHKLRIVGDFDSAPAAVLQSYRHSETEAFHPPPPAPPAQPCTVPNRRPCSLCSLVAGDYTHGGRRHQLS